MTEADIRRGIEVGDKRLMKERIKKEVKPRMLSVDQTAQYIGLASKTIRNRIGPKAKIPFPVKVKRIGGRVLFDVKDLDAYLDRLPTRLVILNG